MSASALRGVARHGLAGGPDSRDGHPLDDVAWDLLLAGAEQHRVLGQLGAAVSAGALAPTAAQAAALDQHLRGWLSRGLRLERLLLAASHELNRAGIDHRVLKGPALAHGVYPDPAWRVFADIDLLVRSADFGRAKELLVGGLGAEPPWPELRPGFDLRFAKDAVLRVDGLELDLHRTLVAGPFGLRLPTEDLFADERTVVVGAQPFLMLGPARLLVHACVNAALGDVPPRLGSLADIATIWQRLPAPLDEVGEITSRWGATAVVQRAIELVTRDLEITLTGLDERARALAPPRGDRLLLKASTGPARSYTRQVANLAVVEGWRNRARYLHAIVAPQPAYLRARGWDRRAHLARARERLTHAFSAGPRRR